MSSDNERLLSGFVNYLKEEHKSTCTVISYAGDIRQWLNFLGEISALKTDEKEVKAFLQKLKAQKANEKTLSRKINALHTFYRSLIKEGKVTIDPATNIKPPKITNGTPRILNKMEYRALRDTARGNLRLAAIVEILLQTGIRIAELAELKVEDLRQDCLIIKDSVKNTERTLQMPNSVWQCVHNYLQTRGFISGNSPLFTTKTGRSLLIRNIRTIIDRSFKKAGIKGAKVNDLRTTWISYQLTNGVDPKLVASYAGHKRLSSTTKYFQEDNKKSYKKKVVEL